MQISSPGSATMRAAPIGCRASTIAAVTGGFFLGTVNSLSSALGSPYGAAALAPEDGVRALEYVAAWTGTAWAWSLLAYMIGWLIRGIGAAAASATAGLIAATIAYYGSDAFLGTSEHLSTGELIYWISASVVVGPTMAVLGHHARSERRGHLVAALFAPALIIASTAMLPTGSDDLQPWSTRAVYLVAAGVAGLIVWQACRRWTQRSTPEAQMMPSPNSCG